MRLPPRSLLALVPSPRQAYSPLGDNTTELIRGKLVSSLGAAHKKSGVPVALLRGWAFAAPLMLIGKAVAVAAVMLPVGGWLAFDVPTAVADLGGMLAAVSLWRTVLLQSLL